MPGQKWFKKNCFNVNLLFCIFVHFSARVIITTQNDDINPLSVHSTKWSSILSICRLLPTNCLSVFDHFVGLALKELISSFFYQNDYNPFHSSTSLSVNADSLFSKQKERLREIVKPIKTTEVLTYCKFNIGNYFWLTWWHLHKLIELTNCIY